MQERVPRKTASPPGAFCDLGHADCSCPGVIGAVSHPADPTGWTRSAGPPNDAMVLPVTMFNDRPFGPVFVPQ